MNLSAPITDLGNAMEAAGICELAYKTSTIESEDAHVFIGHQLDCTIVAFRGSKSAEDWLNDFECEKIAMAGGKVHRGIWMSYMTVDISLRSALPASKPLIILGHSLGGGHATFAASNLSRDFDVAQVITFGSPRVCDASWAAEYDRTLKAKTVRWVNARDIVPRVPFREMGYTHIGNEAFLTSAGTLDYNPGVWEMLHDDVVGGLKDIEAGKLELLSDHHLPSYLARLSALQ